MDGQCMTTDRAIYLGQKAALCDERIQIEMERCQGHAANDLELMRRHKQIDTMLQKETVLLLRKQLDSQIDTRIVVLVSVAATVAVMFGARYLVVQ